MAMTLQDLVDTACLLAGPAGLKRSHDAELLVPRVLTWVGQRAAADPDRRGLITTSHTVGLVNGSQSVPGNVLIEFLDHAAVEDPADPTMARKMRWIPKWSEFTRPLDLTLGYFTVRAGIFHMTRPGVAYTPGVGMTGNITLTTPSKPAIVGGFLTAVPEIEQEAVLALVAALQGAWQPNLAEEVSK